MTGHDKFRALIDTQFADGPLSPLHDQLLRAHVRKCSNCKAYYDRVAQLEGALGGDAAVVARLQARGAPAARVDGRGHRRRWLGGLAAAAGVALAVGLWLRGPQAPPAWTPKGSDGVAPTATRLFHQPPGGEATALGDTLGAADGLLVSYTNPVDGPTHLAVVARDVHGRVLWVHPPWTDPAERPQTVAIQQGVADHELPTVIHHDFKAGPLEICSVFGAAPRDVAAWDAELSRSWPPKGADCRRVEVTE